MSDMCLSLLSCFSVFVVSRLFFFFNDTATTEIYTLSLHDALPISRERREEDPRREQEGERARDPPRQVRVGDERLPPQRQQRVALRRRRGLRAGEQPLVGELLGERDDVVELHPPPEAVRHGGRELVEAAL